MPPLIPQIPLIRWGILSPTREGLLLPSGSKSRAQTRPAGLALEVDLCHGVLARGIQSQTCGAQRRPLRGQQKSPRLARISAISGISGRICILKTDPPLLVREPVASLPFPSI